MSNFIDKEYHQWKSKLILFFKGFSMGFADIIPGVSGGTIALISGIYEHLIYAISSIKFYHISAFFKVIVSRDQKSLERIREVPFIFLMILISGIATGILSMSKLIPFLMEEYPFYTYSLFFGLILFSITIPFKKMEHKWFEYSILLIFSIFTFFLVSVNPYQNYSLVYTVNENMQSIKIDDNGKGYFIIPKKDLQSLKVKILDNQKEIDFVANIQLQRYQFFSLNKTNLLLRMEESKGNLLIKVNLSKKGFFPFLQETMGRYIWIFFVASVAICAMILPGISGAYVLVLFGEYQNILRSLYELDIITILVFIVGVITGILSFVRLLKYLLNNFHSYTMAALTGFLVGSLNKIFPFKYLHSEITRKEIIVGILIMMAGAIFLYFLEKLSVKLGDPEPPI